MRECKSGNHPAACSKHRSQSSATDSAQAAPLFSPLAGASKSWMNAGAWKTLMGMRSKAANTVHERAFCAENFADKYAVGAG